MGKGFPKNVDNVPHIKKMITSKHKTNFYQLWAVYKTSDSILKMFKEAAAAGVAEYKKHHQHKRITRRVRKIKHHVANVDEKATKAHELAAMANQKIDLLRADCETLAECCVAGKADYETLAKCCLAVGDNADSLASVVKSAIETQGTNIKHFTGRVDGHDETLAEHSSDMTEVKLALTTLQKQMADLESRPSAPASPQRPRQLMAQFAETLASPTMVGPVGPKKISTTKRRLPTRSCKSAAENNNESKKPSEAKKPRPSRKKQARS